jgi:uncharacterized protein YecT (DUF1311 family)
MTMLLLAALLLASDGPREDRTAIALERCLASPKAAPAPLPEEGDGPSEEPAPQASPDGRPDGRAACFENALRSYDRRIVDAYRSRLKKASPESAEWLSQANQAWLNYRAQMSGEVDATSAARDHALWLEGLPRS